MALYMTFFNQYINEHVCLVIFDFIFNEINCKPKNVLINMDINIVILTPKILTMVLNLKN